MAISNTERKNDVTRDFDLFSEHVPTEKIIEKINDFEINFRKKIESQKEQFISSLREFCQKNQTANPEQIKSFVEKMVQDYATEVIEEARLQELNEKPIAKEVP